MRKSTIWLLAVVMAFAFAGLLFLQVKYVSIILKKSSEQFNETVKRSMHKVSKNLELDETARYLEEDLSRDEANNYLYQNGQSSLGGGIIHAKELMHGKKSNVKIDTASPIFQGMPEEIDAARYHSLAADTEKIPRTLKVIATADDGEVMAVQHKEYPVYGLQFHPESILTPKGRKILENFLGL